MMKKINNFLLVCLMIWGGLSVQAQEAESELTLSEQFQGVTFRNIGPFRGGRANAITGVLNDPMTYYFGSVGGGVWKTEDAGIQWKNISDGFFKTGSVGAIAVADSDPNVMYVGMGEHAVRGVMTSHGDGIYKSMDAGKTWTHIGLEQSRHIAEIRIHPRNPDLVYVAVQGALHKASEERGIYRSVNGGESWEQILFVDENSGAADISMDANNPRILYASFWDHRRYPWKVVSGGKGSGIYKSTDGGENWEQLTKGLPEHLGKVSVDVSPANSDIVYANIEAADAKGGVYRSNDGGNSWIQTTADRITIARAWYYTEIFADPVSPETVYVLNAPVLKSIDGGKTFKPISNPHTDQHHLWINPANPKNLALANDGGACISFNGGKTWSSQENQPTAQFYRVIADNRLPYHIYAGQQDNSTVAIASRTMGSSIGWKDWYAVAGGESAFLAFDTNDPRYVFGGSYQGNISVYDHHTKTTKDIMAHPVTGLAAIPSEMKYRFNWNAPIIAAPQDPNILYHAGNVVLKSTNRGQSWTEISPDLTRNEKEKQTVGGEPFTIEGAGGENYNTISYLVASPHQAGVLWVGTDDGLVQLTKDEGTTWTSITPKGLGECLINAIEVSPHDPATAYVVATKYKFGDFTPMIYVTTDYGATWKNKVNGIGEEDYVRVVREDRFVADLLYAGTEMGLYISFDAGANWEPFQLNLPVCPILDLTIQDNDLIVATSGRAFWVLDDLSAIQQSKGKLAEPFTLFQPKPTYRFNLSTPKNAPATAGQNPLNGVIIDYALAEVMDSAEMKLEILKANGELVRTYSNKADESLKSYHGGPSKEALLPTQKGVNRFNWDLRRESVPAVPGVFMLGSYAGGLVAPGTYTLRLTVDGEKVETKAEVLANPNIKASTVDYQEQEALTKAAENAVKEIHGAVNEMRKVKNRLEEVKKQLMEVPNMESLVDSATAIVEKITNWEEKLIQPQQKTFQDVINFPNRLNAHFMNLKSRVDGMQPAVTAGAKQRLKDLQQEWAIHQNTMHQLLKNDVQQFNKQYKAKAIPAVVMPELEAEKS